MQLLSFRFSLPVCILAACSAAFAQGAPASATLAFDVASVRPSKPGGPQHTNVPLDSGNVYGTISPDDARTAAGGFLIATHQALWRYISFAYKLSGTQELALRFSIFSGVPKSGAPFWVTGSFDASPEFFDISARAPAATSIDQMRLMMQALLADRFHLVGPQRVRRRSRLRPGSRQAGRHRPKLRPHPASDACTAPLPDQPSAPGRDPAASSAIGNLPPVCGVIAHVPSSAPGQHYGGRAVPLTLFATSVPTMTGLAATPRPVVDQTGLSGSTTSPSPGSTIPRGDDATSDNIANFHEALKNQLGLELKSSHAPISFLIVDHVERPSEN